MRPFFQAIWFTFFLQSLSAQSPPNIVFLFSDDQNLNSVGVYGNPEVFTPNMDQLGNDGVIFDRRYNTTAICMASRANVMTGMYEYKHGTNFDHGDMTPEIWAQTYPILLRANGYYTAFAGKFGFEIDGFGFNAESFFDKWGGGSGQTHYTTANSANSIPEYAAEYPHSTLAYGAFGQDAIREAVAQDKPFCLSLSFKAPHRPTTPDPQFDSVFAGATFTRPVNYGREFSDHMSPQSKTGRQWERFTSWNYDDDYDSVMATYYQQVYGIDVALGMVRETLAAEGVADNTVVVFTSDNGFICGAHGYGSKVLPMEESSRVPLLIYDPRSPSAGEGLRCGALTGNIDFAPYFLELADLPVPAQMDGVSLAPLLEDPSQDICDQLALINVWGPLSAQCLSVVTKAEKYSYWWFSNALMEPFEEVYDLANDPFEFVNLANEDNAVLLEEMRTRYDAEYQSWVNEAVDYNNYQIYQTYFERGPVVNPEDPTITWGDPSEVGNASDISTNGELVTAVNGADNSQAGLTYTVNGVEFVSSSIFGLSNNGDRFGADNTGDVAYDTILSNFDYGDETAFTVTGLEVGAEYEIQVWYMDDRSTASAFGMVLSEASAPTNSVRIQDQFVTGTFVANSESKVIQVLPDGPSRPHLSAYQVRKIADPQLSNFEIWAQGQGISASANEDWNQNGIADLIDFALEMPEPALLQPGSQFSVSLQEEALLDGIAMALYYSTNLEEGWTLADETTGDFVAPLGSTIDADSNEVTSYQLGEQARLFIRYEVELPAAE